MHLAVKLDFILQLTHADAYTEHFGGGTGPILLDEIRCTGSESTLSQCSPSMIENFYCSHHEDGGVQCLTGNNYSGVGSNCGLGGPKYIGTMNLTIINITTMTKTNMHPHKLII